MTWQASVNRARLLQADAGFAAAWTGGEGVQAPLRILPCLLLHCSSIIAAYGGTPCRRTTSVPGAAVAAHLPGGNARCLAGAFRTRTAPHAASILCRLFMLLFIFRTLQTAAK